MPLNYKANNYYGMVLRAIAEKFNFSEHTPLNQMSAEYYQTILYGTGETEYLQVRHFMHGRVHIYRLNFNGIIPWLEKRFRETESEKVRAEIEKYMSQTPCDLCEGARLKKRNFANYGWR